MALKLLNPGLRPLGQFDVEDDDTKPYRPSITWIPSKSAIDM